MSSNGNLVAESSVESTTGRDAVAEDSTIDRSLPARANECRTAGGVPFLLVVCAIVFFARLGVPPLADLDEGAFAQATLEMMTRGDYVSPFLGGEPRFDKPAFIHWLQAASVALLGADELAFRLPSAVAATLWVLLTWAFVRRTFGEGAATSAALVLACSPLVILIGRAATVDAVLNLCIAGACFALHDHQRYGQRSRLWIAAAWMALGFLAKGPIAVAVPGLTLAAWLAWRGRFLSGIRSLLDARAVALFLAIALPWYLLQYERLGWAFIDGFLLRHNLDRLMGPAFGHSAPWWFYLPVTVLATLPFSLALARVLGTVRRSLHDPAESFLLIWFAVVLLVFSLSGSKLPHYLLYGLTGLCILVGLRAAESGSRLAMVPAALAFALAAAFPLVCRMAAGYSTNPYTREILLEISTVLPVEMSAIFMVAALACVVWIIRPFVSAPVAMAGAGIALGGGVGAVLIPAAVEIQQRPVRAAAEFARAQGLRPVMVGINVPSFMVYSGQALTRRAPQPGDVVLTRRVLLPSLGPHAVLFAEGPIALAVLPKGAHR